jgi:DNA-binding NarL/FixJ family response regulator
LTSIRSLCYYVIIASVYFGLADLHTFVVQFRFVKESGTVLFGGFMAALTVARVLVVDASPIYRDGIRDSLIEGGYRVVGEAQDLEQVVSWIGTGIDVVIVGATFQEDESLTLCRLTRIVFPDAKLLLITAFHSDTLFQIDAVASGVDAVVKRRINHEELYSIIKQTLEGHVLFPREILASAFLPIEVTNRERSILNLWSEGRTDKETANILSITLNTVRTHWQNILQKLQVHDHQTAVRRARRRGII